MAHYSIYVPHYGTYIVHIWYILTFCSITNGWFWHTKTQLGYTSTTGMLGALIFQKTCTISWYIKITHKALMSKKFRNMAQLTSQQDGPFPRLATFLRIDWENL